MVGVAVAPSEMARGSRGTHVAPGVGAVVTQASTNPRLGHLGLNLLRAGYSAPRALAEIAASDQFVARPQARGPGARAAAGDGAVGGRGIVLEVVLPASVGVGGGVAGAMFTPFQNGAGLPLWER